MSHQVWLDKPDLLVVSGSHLYGYATEKSDRDTLGIILPPEDYLLGLASFEQAELKDGLNDGVIYSLRRMIDLLIKGNTRPLEILFCPTDKITKITDIGKEFLKNKHLFVSKRFYRSIKGYSYAEWAKARCVNRVVDPKTTDEKELLTQLQGFYNLTSLQFKDILDILYENRPKDDYPLKEYHSTRFLGQKRKDDVHTVGFSTKNAAHCLRLMEQGIEFLRNGYITFPRPNASYLKSIRDGLVQLSAIEDRFKELTVQLDEANENSPLPEQPNTKGIYDFYREIVREKLCPSK